MNEGNSSPQKEPAGRINEDGNLLGRVLAVITLAVVVAGLGRICGVNVCPLANCGTCPFASSQK